MAKLLIAITSDIYVRNYLSTGSFSSLEANFECHFVADQKVSNLQSVLEKTGFRGTYEIPEAVNRRHTLLFHMLMWRNRNKSRTFLYRWMRNSQWHIIDKSKGPFHYLVSILRWFASASINPEGLRIPLLANRFTFRAVSEHLSRRIPVNEQFAKLIESEAYDAVVFPSAAFDSFTADMIRVCRQLDVPSVCLIDNWDNLSSKTVFWEKPDFLGVWGPQANAQAQSIHGFDSTQIEEIGTPRFDRYFLERRQRAKKSPFNFPYILFVGSAMPFDEISALRAIEKTLESEHHVPKNLRVVYRPHPWQQKRKVRSDFVAAEFSRVVLDKQMEGAASQGHEIKHQLAFQPDLNYYPSLLIHATGVVGPLTTMLLEASLCLRPVVALNYFDGVHETTTRRYFTHFEGAESIPGFVFCNEENSIGKLVTSMVTHKPISQELSDEATSRYLRNSAEPYPERLLQLIKRALGGARSHRR